MDKPISPSHSCRLLPLKSTLSSLYLLTSFFGHKNCFHRNRFLLGLGLWITNILIHFTMDFYEAYAIFGGAWATAVGMYLITFVTASSCLAKITLPWLENSLMLLYEAGGYPETLRIMKIVLKVSFHANFEKNGNTGTFACGTRLRNILNFPRLCCTL